MDENVRHVIAGKYKVERELGEGGFGVVYLVRHVDLNVQYALKLLSRSLAANSHFIERFKQEASLLQRFSHPGTVQLRDFGKTTSGHYYLAMDYCEGITLKDVLDRDGPYHTQGAIKLVVQVLDVLEKAHDQGIVHRDIKPCNLMIQPGEGGKEIVRVLDFGTAILRENLDPSSVIEGVSIGTPCYMSPEQASGATDIDHRADIYATGIVLYELLTGEVPYEGESVVQTLLMHITHPPVPFASQYGMADYVEELVFKAIAKNKKDRYQSAKEFKSACRRALGRLQQDRQTLATGGVLPTISQELSPTRRESGVIEPEQKKQETTKILCLDDDEMVLNIMRHLLESAGFEVYTAIDCSSIHDYLYKHDVTLLVSDVQMPGMMGTKVCRLLKSSMPELKVMLFSNIPERELEKFSEENKADGWISKNSKPNVWLDRIQEVIDAE